MLLLVLLVCTTHASSWFTTKKQQPKQRTKPNILVLLADDHSAEALGYRAQARLGPLIKQLNVTPHLDQLAKEGITTDNAYTINALCTPARASILTGLYPNKHGATHLKPVSKGNASGVHDYIETYPEVLQRHGYATALYGKYHLMSRPKGFDRYEVLLHQGSYEDPLLLNHTLSSKRWKARMKLWTRKRSDSGGSRAEGHTSDIISAKAAEAVASLSKPWLVEAHFKEPHEPFHYPPRYEALTGAPVFDASRGVWTLRGFDVAEPPTLMQHPTRCRGIDVFANRSLANATRRRTYAQLVADYLRTLKALDDGVGRVLRRVDDENTLVLYTSDHGYFLGEQQRTIK
jgi:arylsulfatase A-like enzyme